MQPHITVDVSVGTLRSMNEAQFNALRDNILNDGRWETANKVMISGHGEYIGVHVGGMFIGIEKDGYVHS